MKKHDTFHSFQDLDAARAKKIKAPKTPLPEKNPPSATVRKKTALPAPAIEDEAALFLAAVSGSIDVSLKSPPVLPEKASANNAPEKIAEPLAAHTQALRQQQPEKTPPAPMPTEDVSLFANAMDGVAPIRAKGRDLAPPVKPAPPTYDYAASMDEIFSGALEFSLEYTDEFIQGHVLGVDPAIMGKLRAGAYSPEGHVDLHGQHLEQAYATLSVFIKEAYQRGKRHLLVITGRGKNSPGGTPVLRERVQAWFTRDPFKRVVLAFCTAQNNHGGAGALYVLLRKRKKNQGKIVWDRTPSEEELLL